MAMKDFHRGTTKKFKIRVLYNNKNQNISDDTVSIVFKLNKGGAPVISKNADLTFGDAGIAEFVLTSVDNNVTPAKYYYQIMWIRQTGEKYSLTEGTVKILENV